MGRGLAVLFWISAAAAFADVSYSRPLPGPTRHVVQGGDSLWSIARRYDPDDVCGMIDAIRAANPELQYRLLKAGEKLIIPRRDRVSAMK